MLNSKNLVRSGVGFRLTAIAALAGAFVAAPAFADDAASVQSLDQRIRVLERQLEIQKEEADTKAKDGAGVTAGDKGFSFKSNDGNFELKLRTLIQADGRFYLGEPAGQGFNDTFLVRRVEPSFQGSLGKLIGFTFTPQFGANQGSTTFASVTDLFIDLKFDPAATVRVGRFKGAASGLENLQPTGAIKFVERGLPTNISPTRDYGVQLQGVLFNSTLSYAVGVFNGAPDGKDAPASSDVDNRKEVEARIFAEPFKNDPGFFQGLGFGVAGSYGDQLGAVANAAPSYVTTGQNAFFTYATTDVTLGHHTRIEPQAYFYRNGLGVIGEYTISRVELGSSAAGPKRGQSNNAYQVAATYLLTGEDASFNQPVRPSSPYKVGGPGWGALEVGARFSSINVDQDAFVLNPAVLATAATSATQARDYGAVVSWYPTVNLKLAANYDFTAFHGGAAGGTNRPDERALFVRAQIWY